MKSLLPHILAAAIIFGCVSMSIGARRRTWPPIAWGAAAIGAAALVGNWIFL